MSSDVIGDDFTSPADNGIWDFSPMRLGSRKDEEEGIGES